MTDLAVRSGSTLTIATDQQYWSDRQLAALHQLGLADASSADLQVFFHQCQRTGLDPFARQIHMIGRNVQNPRTNQWETKYTIQTGIDGFRRSADELRPRTMKPSKSPTPNGAAPTGGGGTSGSRMDRRLPPG
jgi:hypothetical protein